MSFSGGSVSPVLSRVRRLVNTYRESHPRRTVVCVIGGLLLLVFLLANSAGAVPSSGRYLEYAYPPSLAVRPRPALGPVDLQAAVARSEELWANNVAKRKAFIEEQGGLTNMREFTTNTDHSGGGQAYTLWDVYVPSFPCPWEVERIGRMADGGKITCGLPRMALSRGKDLVIYSIGVERESSWEAEILARTDAQVWMYDYSVNKYGPQLQEAPRNISERAHFFQYGLGEKDDVFRGNQFYTLQSLMHMNGHDHIDILKVDIEGAEFGILPKVIEHFGEGNLPFDQLLLEIHADATRHSYATDDFGAWWDALESAGLRAFSNELNYPAIHWNPYPTAMEMNFLNNCNGKSRCGHLLRD